MMFLKLDYVFAPLSLSTVSILFLFFFIFMRGRIRNFLHILLDTHIGRNPFHLNKKYRK